MSVCLGAMKESPVTSVDWGLFTSNYSRLSRGSQFPGKPGPHSVMSG